MTSALDALETFSGHLVSFVFTAVPIAGTEVNLIVIWLAAAIFVWDLLARRKPRKPTPVS